MTLHLLSPLDGRYAETTSPLRDHFSEFAFLRDRVRVELNFLPALSKTGLVRPLSDSESAHLESVLANFSDADAELILEYERKTRHDVKAIEYFIQSKLQGTSLEDLIPWIHFGLTSEDTNSLGQAIALKESRDKVILPNIESLISNLSDFALKYKSTPMLARTHGQFAVPTTLGKEFAVYIARLKKTRDEIASHKFEAKLTGAVGNFNALQAAVPNVDWISFSKEFVSSFGLEPNLLTTQILPYDNWVRYFDLIRLTNSILIDFAQDVWRYISDGYLKQAVVAGEVGSSTMPQKVNPIDFENAEGNLGVANSLFAHYAQKLTVSRLQRDLSDSTVRRTFGTALGHSLLAWTNFQRGLKRIAPDEEKLTAELNAHWEVVSEGAQTILRAAGKSDAYESLKEQTRGRVLTESDYKAWCDSIDVDNATREKLKALSPETYIGLAVELTNLIVGGQ
ncbi:adenylosuccinate lyase [Candidatus Villigracilis affinis]|uniref:adenylosuccinate lyase n=1 Tax=Candidatus Villigracilis affinis TaxID=3140682 RepID=UPI001D29FD8F|nr:adenylosuccinate lyase [Anaerolineales bacterium]